MDIETRLSNLENLVTHLAETINRNKFYGDADTAGARQSITNNTSDIEDNSNAIFELAEIIGEMG